MSSITLEALVEQSVNLLQEYEGAKLYLLQKSEDYAKALELKTDESITLLRKEIEVLDVDATINLLTQKTQDSIAELQTQSDTIVAQMEEKLASLDIDAIIADFNNQALAILEEIKSVANTNMLVELETIDSAVIKCNSNSYCIYGSTTYSSFMRVSPTKFAIAKLLHGSTYNNTEATITPFEIDADGKIIDIKTPTQLFYNSSDAGISTTEFFAPDDTGKLFAYGNNSYPGYTSHTFGYFYGRVDPADNSVANVGYSANSSYHQTNGQFGGMYDSTGSGFYMVGSSYDSSDSRNRHIRINYTGTTPSLGVTNPSSDTSTGYATRIIPQKGVSNPNITGIIHYRTSDTAYYERAYDSAGNYTNYQISSWDSNMIAFVLSNGAVLNIGNGNGGYIAVAYTAYNQRTVITDTNIDISYFYPYWAGAQIVNVGKDTWIAYNYNARVLFKFSIDPTTYKITILGSVLVGLSIGTSSQTFIKLAGVNGEFLVVSIPTSSNYQTVKVVKNPLV